MEAYNTSALRLCSALISRTYNRRDGRRSGASGQLVNPTCSGLSIDREKIRFAIVDLALSRDKTANVVLRKNADKQNARDASKVHVQQRRVYARYDLERKKNKKRGEGGERKREVYVLVISVDDEAKRSCYSRMHQIPCIRLSRDVGDIDETRASLSSMLIT